MTERPGGEPTTAYVRVRTSRPAPWYGTHRGFEQAFERYAGATGHEVVAQHGVAHERRMERRIRRLIRRYPSVLEPARSGPPADLGVVWANDLTDAAELFDLDPTWIDFARTRVLLLTECWPGDFDQAGGRVLSGLREFDLVLMAVENHGVDQTKSGGVRIETVEKRVHTDSYRPRLGERRPISVINYGRRDPGQHDALLEWSRQEGRWYHYDASKIGATPDPLEHHAVLGQLISSSAAAINNPGRFDAPDRVLGAEEVGFRHYEALAGGCVIVGARPNSEVFARSFGDLPGIVDWPLGTADGLAELTALLDDQARLDHISRTHRARALADHDVAHGIAEMYELLDIGVPEGIRQRVAALDAQAAELLA